MFGTTRVSEHDKELARIAGYMHDIGNAINRSHHAEYGALLANSILEKQISEWKIELQLSLQ